MTQEGIHTGISYYSHQTKCSSGVGRSATILAPTLLLDSSFSGDNIHDDQVLHTIWKVENFMIILYL